MSGPRVTDDKIRDNGAPAVAEGPIVSRALSGPLAALGAAVTGFIVDALPVRNAARMRIHRELTK